MIEAYMANGRKIIMGIIGNTLFIDPRDTEKVDVETIKSKIPGGMNLNVVVEKVDKWMPESGTEALMKQASKALLKPSEPLETPRLNRRQLRALKANAKKKRKF